MITLDYKNIQDTINYVEDSLKEVVFDKNRCFAIGIKKNGCLIAGVVYSNYRYWDIEMSIASSSSEWCNRRVLRELFSYPFIYLKTNRVTATCRKSNKKARKLVERLGFRQEGVHMNCFSDKVKVISYGLTNCKWIK